MKARDLLDGLNFKCISGDLNINIDKVVLDSRQVVPGTAFVAMIGQKSDGHKYLEKAAGLGASLIVADERRYSDCEETIKRIIDQYKVTVIVVDDSRAAFSDLSCRFFGHPSKDMTMIGITGTKGKTTSTYIVNAILNHSGRKCGLIGSVENKYGDFCERSAHTTPEAWEFQELLSDMKEDQVTHCVMEVSSLGLKFNRTDNVKFEVAVFTNFLNDHISPEEHPTEKDYFDSKIKLFSQSRIALINKNSNCFDDIATEAGKYCEKVYSYSFTQPADFYVKEYHSTLKDGVPGMAFTFVTPTYETAMFIPLICDFNVDNALCAASTAYLLGVSPEEILDGMQDVRVPGRMEKIDNDLGLQIYVDYAHNGDSLKVLLQALRHVCKGRIITVFGCGGDRPADRRYTMGEASGRYSDITIVTTDNSRSESFSVISGMIVEGINRAPDNPEYCVIEDRKEAIRKAIEMAGKEDIVVIAGKGHELTMDIQGNKVRFVDAEEASDVLRRLEAERKGNEA